MRITKDYLKPHMRPTNYEMQAGRKLFMIGVILTFWFGLFFYGYRSVFAAEVASGSITVVDADSCLADTVTVDGDLLIAGTAWAVDSGNDAAAASLASAIGGVSGVNASASGPTVTVTAETAGASGNDITLATSDESCATVSGATLSGGEDDPEPFCGDSVIDDGEQCDDGNDADGDGCDSMCQAEGVPLIDEESFNQFIIDQGMTWRNMMYGIFGLGLVVAIAFALLRSAHHGVLRSIKNWGGEAED